MSQVIYHLRKVFEKKGDALNMPSPDAAFDVVLSKFGVMFAPNQEKAASELIHVCRPGGAIGLANCMSGGLFGEMSRIIAKYASSAPGLIPAALWGTKERVHELFGEGVTPLQTRKRDIPKEAFSPVSRQAKSRLNRDTVPKTAGHFI